MEIFWKNLGNATKPSRGTKKAAGWDLTTVEDVELDAYKPTLVKTEIACAIPEGTMLLVMPRSGNSLKRELIVPNSPGLVDEDYRGHLYVMVSWIPHPADLYDRSNSGPPLYEKVRRRLNVEKGTRIAQAVLVKYEEQEWVEVPELPSTERGEGGFGSTDKRG